MRVNKKNFNSSNHMNHLDHLEAEAIYIIRAIAQADKPVMLILLEKFVSYVAFS